MNFNPANQLSLYGHHFEFCNFIGLYKNKKLPNKILDSNRVKRDIITAYKYGLKSLYYIRSKDKSNISETILDEACEGGACEI